MPYHVVKKGDQWCVVKTDGGKEMGCSDSDAKAQAQMRALLANEHKAFTPINTGEHPEAHPVPGCVDATARRYEDAGMNPVTALARAEEDCVEAAEAQTGIETDSDAEGTMGKALDNNCFKKALDKHLQAGLIQSEAERKARAECTDSTPPIGYDKAVTDKPRRSFDERLRAGLKALGLLPDTTGADVTSFKVRGNHWLATWSNDFKDRDGEIFTRKAIDDYVTRVDAGTVKPPELWVWHVGKQVAIGNADWVGRAGHFLVASGQFYGGGMAQHAKAYYAKHAQETGISHGFSFPSDQFDGKHYHQFNTFEISLLPRGSEANLYTSLEGVKAMALNDTKKQYLITVFGKDQAERIEREWDERGKALEENEVEFKDFTDSAEPPAAHKEAVDHIETAFKDLIPDLLEGQSAALRSSTEVMRVVKALRDDMDALAAQLRLAPRSVQRGVVPETVISKEDAESRFKVTAGAESYYDPVLHTNLKRNPYESMGGE